MRRSPWRRGRHPPPDRLPRWCRRRGTLPPRPRRRTPLRRRGSGSISPNQTTSGRIRPPHSGQCGSDSRLVASTAAPSARCWHRVQRSWKREPWSRIGSARCAASGSADTSLAARSCRSSTFWETSVTPGRESAQRARARCAAFGRHPRTVSRRHAYHSQTSRGSRPNAIGDASSSGRNCFQSPPSPRKVGMPDSALTPAPVSTTTLSAFASAARARAASAPSGLVTTRNSPSRN